MKLKISGLAVFRKDKLIGWLNEDESKGYNFIMDNIESSVGSLECPDGGGRIVLEAVHSSTKMKGKVEKGKPVIEIDLKYRVNVSDIECQIDIEDPAVIRRLERQSEERLIALMKKTVSVMQHKYKVDSFGFGQRFTGRILRHGRA